MSEELDQLCVNTVRFLSVDAVQNAKSGHPGMPLGADEVRLTKQKLGWPTEPSFLIPESALAHFRDALARGARDEAAWTERMVAYTQAFPELAEELRRSLRGELPPGWDADIPVFPADAKGMATRVASGKVMNAVAPRLAALTGGSADLNPSTHTTASRLARMALPTSRSSSWPRCARFRI